MKNSKKRKLGLRFLFVFLLLISGELILRLYFGFCDAPLYLTSDKYEYINAPNQSRYRFRKRCEYNQYSMRSDSIIRSKIQLLGLGDSVINGGSIVDQTELATTIVTKETEFQLLNISAGSWGPDNCAAYIREKGLFNAKALVLVTSSHDAYDNMEFEPKVDVHQSYPSKQYKMAYWELTHRYLLPRMIKFINLSDKIDSPVKEKLNEKNKKGFNPGFDEIKYFADSAKIPLLIYLHPERNEMDLGKYNDQGQEIIAWAKNNEVYLFLGIQEDLDSNCYIDGIHFSSIGQRKLANSIKVMLEQNNFY